MVAANELLRVFWPVESPRNNVQGTIIGWRNSPVDIFVVTILQNAEQTKVETALRMGTLYRESPHPIRRMFHLCGYASMQVLGMVNSVEPCSGSTSNHLQAHTTPVDPYPRIFCPRNKDVAIQVILFHRPSPHQMQFMSLTPIPLILGDKPMKIQSSTTSSSTLEQVDGDDYDAKSKLLQKLKLHTVISRPPSQKEILLPTILAQINCSAELSSLMQRNAYMLKARQKRSLSVGEQVVEKAVTIRDLVIAFSWKILTEQILPVATKGFIMGLICHRFVAEIILRVLEWRPRPDSAALKDLSATAQQTDIRLQQFCYWPIQYVTLQKRKDDWESITDRHSDYIRFFNSLWLVANDVIIGIALGSYIIDNATWVAWQIDEILTSWTIDGLRDMISWLMDWPAGLKLNNELAIFLGDLFLWVIDCWRDCIGSLKPLLPHIIYFIGFASFAGATMPIAMFSDLLSLLTVHIYCFYTASARIFHWQLTIIMSLFHLFRGKKHNVLRNRIDSCDYNLDQLLLGTILFTLLFFLLPTVGVFYLTFTSARMATIFLMAALDTLLACLNHFPLFALMLRIKDSRRLPGGICFDLCDTPSVSVLPSDNEPISSTSYIILKSVPLPLRAMFDQYFQLGHRIRKHYLSPSVILCLVTGQFLPPIHRRSLYSLQYSMLPAQRASVSEVWTRLKESSSTKLTNGVAKMPYGTMNGTSHSRRVR